MPKIVLTFHCLNKLFQWSQNFCEFPAVSLKFQKFFSITRTFFFTVGQNNFDNRILILYFFLVLKSINRNAYALTNNLVADNITEDLQQANIERDKLLEEEKKKTEAEKAKSGKCFIFIYVLFLSLFFFSFHLEEEKKRAENEKVKNGKYFFMRFWWLPSQFSFKMCSRSNY